MGISRLVFSLGFLGATTLTGLAVGCAGAGDDGNNGGGSGKGAEVQTGDGIHGGAGGTPSGGSEGAEAGAGAGPSQGEPTTDPAEPLANAFAEGPYGTTPYSVAGPFTIETTTGAWDFEQAWTGNDTYFFIHHRQGIPYAEQLWTSSLRKLLAVSPANAHYFFITFATDARADLANTASVVERAIAGLPQADRARWQERVHVVNTLPRDLEGWIADVLRAEPYVVFAIDRSQRLREVGLLRDVIRGGGPQLRHLAYEADYFNFEYERDQQLAADLANPNYRSTTVTVFDNTLFPGGWGASVPAEVALPDAATMAGFDTMHIELSMTCPERKDANCPEWDHLVRFSLCHAPDAPAGTAEPGESSEPGEPGESDSPATTCTTTTEIARWISTYHREGRWVTDISPMLAFMQDGGTRTFSFAAHQANTLTLKLHLSDRGTGLRPVGYAPLFTGGSFGPDYNSSREAAQFLVPRPTTKMELVANITGHGWGTTAENCAEFCNHSHAFVVNGLTYTKEHPAAGTFDGCAQEVNAGVVPNQYGTWPLGRAGWCPGQDVKPFRVDVSESRVEGGNVATYRGLYQGADYQPTPADNPNGQGFGPTIDMQSYLIFWAPRESGLQPE